MKRPTLTTSPVERNVTRRARITLLELRPERHHRHTCQPGLGDGVILKKSRWGKRELLPFVFYPSPYCSNFKAVSFAWCFFSFSFCIGRKHRSAYGLTANWFNIVQIGRYYSVPAGRRCVSFSSLLQSHALPNCENTTQSERQTRLRDTPDPSSSRRLSSPPRDHRPPSRDTRQSRAGFCPSYTQIRVSGPQTGTPNGPNQLFSH